MIRFQSTMNYNPYLWFSFPRAISALDILVYAAGDVVDASARNLK